MNMEEFETKLIIEVEAHPLLYNKTLAEYKTRDKKGDSWELISKVLGKPAIECQKKWGNLRDSFARLFNLDQSIPSGSKPVVQTKWKHFNSLRFLSEFTKIPSTLSNYEELNLTSQQPNYDNTTTIELLDSDMFDEIIEIDLDPEQIAISEPPKKKRRGNNDIGEKIFDAITSLNVSPSPRPPSPPPPPPLKQYFISLARQAMRLNNQQQLQLQINCMRALEDIEFYNFS